MALDYSYSDVAKMIDHSLLNPTFTWDELEHGIALALAYDVASVCIMPYALKHCAERLRGSNVRASTTIGFPHGGHSTAIKVAEARQALADGGEELDMVVNISKVLSGDWDYVSDDLAPIVRVAHAAGSIVKVGQSKSWQPRGGEIEFNIAATQTLPADARVAACVRWRHVQRPLDEFAFDAPVRIIRQYHHPAEHEPEGALPVIARGLQNQSATGF